nr:hypothetical protein [Tanacetum cinerariifolium]
MEGNRRGKNVKGIRPSKIEAREGENWGANLPPFLAAHLGRNENSQPLRSSLTSVQGGHQPLTSVGETSHLMAFTKNSVPSYNGPMHPIVTPSSNYPYYTQPMYVPPNMPTYQNPARPFADFAGSVTPFVRWIEDSPLPNGLKMPSYFGPYDGKGDPNNFLHLFEGAIHMQKLLMLIAYHMFTYTLKDFARICWNSPKAGIILNYEDLKDKFRSHLSQQKKYTKTHLAVHNIEQREGESTRAFITRYTDDTLQILGLQEEQRISGFVHSLRTRSLVEHLSTDLPSTYKGLMEKTYTWVEAREVDTNGASNDQRERFIKSVKKSKGNSRHRKGCKKLLIHPQRYSEASDCEICLGQLLHLVKGIKKKEQSHLTSHEEKAERIKARHPLKHLYLWPDSPHNMLLRRTVMQRMGIVVSTIHGAIKFHTKKGIRTVLLIDEANEGTKRTKSIPATSKERVLSCVNAEERIIVNDNIPTKRLLGFRLKCFLDTYKGYHQIQMAEEDKDKTTFYPGEGVYCYKKMSFGLKNAGATYQRLVDKVFSHQIGSNLEAYVDDMVIKSTFEKEMLTDKQETFERKSSQMGNQIREHDIVFLKREEKETPSDFLVEIPSKDNEGKEKPNKVPNSSSKWRLYTDEASNSDGSRAGLMLINFEGKEYTYALCFEFETTNNEAEYEALLSAKQASIKDYLQKVKTALRGFEDYTVEHVRRNQNKKEDALSKLASMTFEHLKKEVLVKVLTKRLIEKKEVLELETQERKSWIDPIYEYLLSGLLPKDTIEAQKIRI